MWRAFKRRDPSYWTSGELSPPTSASSDHNNWRVESFAKLFVPVEMTVLVLVAVNRVTVAGFLFRGAQQQLERFLWCWEREQV